jgi:hypothetical protein
MRLLLIAVILIHSWYPQSCCGGKDCHPVPCDQIKKVDNGYTYEGIEGQAFFPQKTMKISEDEQCHVCIAKGVEPAGICIFLVPRV